MTYTVGTYAGAPAITNHDTSAKVPMGTIVKGWDPTYGEGEFIYLLGVASTVAGSVVTYSNTTFATALTNTINVPNPIAVAMAATVASEYGWYQISGNAVATKTYASNSLLAGAAVGLATGGTIGFTITGLEVQGGIVGAVSPATTTSTTVTLTINRPHMQGRIT